MVCRVKLVGASTNARRRLCPPGWLPRDVAYLAVNSSNVSSPWASLLLMPAVLKAAVLGLVAAVARKAETDLARTAQRRRAAADMVLVDVGMEWSGVEWCSW